jgi:hypothetical protein
MIAMGGLLMFSVRPGRHDAAPNPGWDEDFLKEFVRFISTGMQSDPAVSPAKWRRNPPPAHLIRPQPTDSN